MLLESFIGLIEAGWFDVFAQQRSRQRALEHALGRTCAFSRRTISRTICAQGRLDRDWSAEYKLFSRSPWKQDDLFDPVIAGYLRRFPSGPIAVAFDDTTLQKSGRKIKSAAWSRDPLSPPFHPNLIWGLRFAQASLLFPLYREGQFDPRGLPIRFWDSPALKKPGKRATEEQKADYKKMKKLVNLSTRFLDQMLSVRANLDTLGAWGRTMIAAVDGSLCNRTIFRAALERMVLVARCRKDARLCFPAPPGSRKKYDDGKFTPEQIRQDENIPWQTTEVFFGGQWRTVRYKEVRSVLWQRGAGLRPLRSIVVAPTPYKMSRNAKADYRQPAYLLTTDVSGPIQPLLQAYFDRWQIEVNHRDEKQLFGVGQAQVWSKESVPRQPAFAAAVYSLLLLAGLETFGPARTEDYLPLPSWRKKARRASTLDLISLIRKEINETPNSTFALMEIPKNTRMYAYG
jgi:hypothetical protein